MIVAIDGPAGAGKSSTARRLAERLGYRYLDTGAMYRAVALAALRRNIDWADAAALLEVAQGIDLSVQGERIWLNGEEVTEAIRSVEVTRVTKYPADHPGVRAVLVELQQRVAQGQDMVTEGRDQGTVVFPDARCKFFLTASPEERAKRRWREMQARGQAATYEEILRQQSRRDDEDAQRIVGRLVPAADAVQVCTDGLEEGEVVERLEHMVRQRLADDARGPAASEP